MYKQNKNSMLVAGVPLERGAPKHFEHDDQTAFVHMANNKVDEIHTPKETLSRVHELMHARHTDERRAKRQYAGINDMVRNFVEDARIHELFWPWPPHGTPRSIAEPCIATNEEELATAAKMASNPVEAAKNAWPVFAVRLRAVAVREGMGDWNPMRDVGFTNAEKDLAYEALKLIRKNREGMAAKLLQAAFFPPVEVPGIPVSKRGGKKEPGKDKSGTPRMEVIELQHLVAVNDTVGGTRPTTSGPRLDRSAIRRPVLPVRCFVRRQPTEPAGTILIDASGSMGDFNEIREWCEKSPYATVAYYSGTHNKGWLYVYSRDGYRAPEAIEPPAQGNTVDGPAIDWLLKQDGPRFMITDRQFCGAFDSDAQVVRLANLERAGEITVMDYSKK